MNRRKWAKKIKEEQLATAHVFEEFINTFQNEQPSLRPFIKSSILYSDNANVKLSDGETYNPKPLGKYIANNERLKNINSCAKICTESKFIRSKKNEKPKSNLDLLKEELKQKHLERNEKRKLNEGVDPGSSHSATHCHVDDKDPHSTNLFVGNIKPNITESDLIEAFGEYGPLASIKIMWPRGKEDQKKTNCGFVAFMCRRDAERALNDMQSESDFHIVWGKTVELPSHPIYIPQKLLQLFLPPPQSGLPFNAQLKSSNKNIDIDNVDLADTFVQVTIPFNRKVLLLIHRVIEFVVKEGPLFEAMIMNKELENLEYHFLFENTSVDHVYYRWKLFSVLQGDSLKDWSMKPFRMYETGSIWLPPTALDYSKGMPESLIKNNGNAVLSDYQYEHFVSLIRKLSISRNSISEAMFFCLNSPSVINSLIRILIEALSNIGTNPVSKIARLYLLSDIISNCVKKRVAFDMPDMGIVLDNILATFNNLSKEIDRESYRVKTSRVLLQMSSLGILNDLEYKYNVFFNATNTIEDDNSSSDEPLDGANLLKRSLKINNKECEFATFPINLKQKRTDKTVSKKSVELCQYFIPSKWDDINPEQVELESVTSSQLYDMELMDLPKIKLHKHCGKSTENKKKREEERNKEYNVPW